MMTSDDIARIAQQHQSLFDQTKSLTASIGQAVGVVPPPPSEMTPAFTGAQQGGMLAANVATGAAQGAVGALGAIGAVAGFGLLGKASGPLSWLDPFSGAFNVASAGFSSAGGFGAMAKGSFAPVARGLAGGVATLGGYMAAGALFNAMTEQVTRGAQEQMQAQEMLKSQISMRSMPNMQFSTGTIGAMATSMRQMASSELPFSTISGIAQAGMQAGMYQHVSSASQFAERTRSLVQTTTQLAAVNGGGVQEAFGAINQAQRMGFYGGSADSAALHASVTGQGLGVGSAIMQAGTYGAGVASGFGMSRRQGAGMAMGLAARISGGVRSGALNSDAIQDMMGGQTLEEGVGGLAGTLAQGAYAAASDRNVLMGLIDKETGHIDQGLAAQFASGNMSRLELRRNAMRNRNDRGARMAVQARSGSLASELMNLASPEELMAGMARSDMLERGVRPGESQDDVISLSMQKFGKMGEEQANLVRELIKAGPSIKNDMSSRVKEIVTSMNAGAPQPSVVDALKKRLVDKYVEPWAAPLRELGASISEWGSGLADSAVEKLVGKVDVSGPVTAGGQQLLSKYMRGDRTVDRLAAGSTGGYRRTGMQFAGQNLLLNNDKANFGEVGLMDTLPDGTAAMGTIGAMAGIGLAGSLMGAVGSSMASAGWGAIQAGASGLTSSLGSAALGAGAAGPATMGIGRAAGMMAGGAVRGGVGMLGMAGSALSRLVANPVTVGIAALSAGGDLGSYLSSYNNAGSISEAQASALESMGMYGRSSGVKRGSVAIAEQEKGWLSGVGTWMGLMTYSQDDESRRASQVKGSRHYGSADLEVNASQSFDDEMIARATPALLSANMDSSAYLGDLASRTGGGSASIVRMRQAFKANEGDIRSAAALGAGTKELVDMMGPSMDGVDKFNKGATLQALSRQGGNAGIYDSQIAQLAGGFSASGLMEGNTVAAMSGALSLLDQTRSQNQAAAAIAGRLPDAAPGDTRSDWDRGNDAFLAAAKAHDENFQKTYGRAPEPWETLRPAPLYIAPKGEMGWGEQLWNAWSDDVGQTVDWIDPVKGGWYDTGAGEIATVINRDMEHKKNLAADSPEAAKKANEKVTKEAEMANSYISSVINKGGANMNDLLKLVTEGDTEALNAMLRRDPKMDDKMKTLLSSMAKGSKSSSENYKTSEELRKLVGQGVVGPLMKAERDKAAQADLDALGIESTVQGRFVKGTAEGDRLAMRMGSRQMQDILGTASAETEAERQSLQASMGNNFAGDMVGGALKSAATASMEELVGKSLKLNDKQRGALMSSGALRGDQQRAVAIGSAITESMTNKRHSRARNLISGLSILEDEDGILDRDFTRSIGRQLAHHDKLLPAQMADIEKLVKLSGYSGDMGKIREDIAKVAKGGQAGKEGAEDLGKRLGADAGTRVHSSGGGKAMDVSQTIAAFNTAIGKAADVISKAAEVGKNMSGGP